MTMAERRRLEEIFSAEMILTRVCLHIMQRETTDIAAQMLAIMRLQEIQDEGTRLRRRVVLSKRQRQRQT